MNAQIKDVGQMLLITVPLIIGLYVYWINCPMFKNVILQQRESAQSYLQQTYYHNNRTLLDREALINQYGFTVDELNPEQFILKAVDKDDD